MAEDRKELKLKNDTRSRSWFIVCPNVDKNGVCGLTAEEAGKLSEQELCEYVVCQWASSTRRGGLSVLCIKRGNEALTYCSLRK